MAVSREGSSNFIGRSLIMLVLTRKLNEEITIGHLGITVKVVEVRGGRVRLGVEAPRDIRIERTECQAEHTVDAPHTEPAHS
jgi:carbon storage regulator